MTEKLQKFLYLFLILSVFGALALTAIVSPIRNRNPYTFYENRLLAEIPAFTWEGALDGSYFLGVDRSLQEHTLGRTTMLKALTVLDVHILRRPVVNKVVITDDILLPWLEYDSVDTDAIAALAEEEAARIAAHAAQVEENGGCFLYAAVPCQYAALSGKYPAWLNNREEYTAASSAALFAALEKRGVRTIDMEPILSGDLSLSSAVDNHYSIRGAYLTYREIQRAVAEVLPGVTCMEEGDFTLTPVRNAYLGSRERALFDLWLNDESLWLLEANDDVPMRLVKNGGATEKHTVYALPDDPDSYVTYNLYMGGDLSESALYTDRPELPSLLVYGDSFTNAVECILWHDYDTMRSLDLRYYTGGTLEDCIAQYKPDVVVCIRDYQALLDLSGNGG